MERALRRAISLCEQARRCYQVGNYPGARRRYERAIAWYGRAGIGDQEVLAGLAAAWQNAGSCSYVLAEDREAYRCFRHALELHRRLEDLPAVATVLNNLGAVCVRLGRLKQARSYLERCRRVDEHLRDEAGLAVTLHNLARLAERAGEREAASALYEFSRGLFRDLGWDADARREEESLRRLRLETPGGDPGPV